MVDAADLKSVGRKAVRVQVPPWGPRSFRFKVAKIRRRIADPPRRRITSRVENSDPLPASNIRAFIGEPFGKARHKPSETFNDERSYTCSLLSSPCPALRE